MQTVGQVNDAHSVIEERSLQSLQLSSLKADHQALNVDEMMMALFLAGSELHAIDFGSKNEVILAQTVDRMSRQVDPYVAVAR